MIDEKPGKSKHLIEPFFMGRLAYNGYGNDSHNFGPHLGNLRKMGKGQPPFSGRMELAS
jgi:hypothetical protein